MDERYFKVAKEIGHATVNALAEQEFCELVLDHESKGFIHQDCVLYAVLRKAKQNKEFADEFVRYIFKVFQWNGRLRQGSSIRPVVTSDDLAQSVLTRVWDEILKLEFRTLDEFKSLLHMKLVWLIQEKEKASKSLKRREDLRVSLDLSEVSEAKLQPDGRELLEEVFAVLKNEKEDMQTKITIVELYLAGNPPRKISEQVDWNSQKISKFLSHLFKRLRKARSSDA